MRTNGMDAEDLLSLSPDEMQVLRQVDPELWKDVRRRLTSADERIERERCEGSLLEFMKRAWQEIDPAPLELNWHHEVICEHLEAVAYGEIRHLIINVPPRHSKTMVVNVLYPAWTWALEKDTDYPLIGAQVKFLSVSYGALLSEEIAVKAKRLILGEWYQRLWGSRVQLLEDQKARANFANTMGGERLSNSIEGGILGRGGDVQILDDVQTRRGADSERQRADSLQGMADLMTRFTDPRRVAKVLVMQRLHLQDATNWALENWPADTVHLMLPARYESDRRCFCDMRSKDGELLWPKVWTDEELGKIERGLSAMDGEILSDFAVSGQLQQNPVPRGGGIVNKDDWMIWPESVPRLNDLTILPNGQMFMPLPEVSHVIVVLDTALSEKETADWNACIVFGVWHRPRLVTTVGHDDPFDDGEQPRVVMMGGWRRRCRLNDEEMDPDDGLPKGLVQRVDATARRFQADRIVIENKTRGLDVKNELERQLQDRPYTIDLFEPRRHGDKVSRLNAVQPLFKQGLVYAPALVRVITDPQDGVDVRVSEYQWVQHVTAEVEAVPRGSHDDYADCVSSGLLTLREGGYLELTQEFVRNQVAIRSFRPRGSRIKEHYGV